MKLILQYGYLILTRHEIAAVRHNHANIERELNRVGSLIAEPAAFLTLIHDDLGNARQTFEVGDQICLLDFEYAKFSHALLDFGKPLVGKFELNLETGVYAWTGPHFPLALLDHYRRYSETTFGVHYDDQTWREAASAAITYSAITLVGRLCRLEPHRQLQGTVRQNIQAIFTCLMSLLVQIEEPGALCSFLEGYAKDM